MALQFNNYVKLNTIFTLMKLNGNGASNSLKIYPSSVAMPAFPPAAASAPAGFLINFTNFTTARLTNQLKLTVAPALTAAVATGVPSWFFYISSQSSVMIGDSIGLTGTNPIITLTSMNLVSGTNYGFTDMTLTMI